MYSSIWTYQLGFSEDGHRLPSLAGAAEPGLGFGVTPRDATLRRTTQPTTDPTKTRLDMAKEGTSALRATSTSIQRSSLKQPACRTA